MNLSTIFKLKGINYTLSGACASGSHAIGMGYQFIKAGMQDMVICGGAQEIHWSSMGSFDALGTFSVHTDDPPKASKPFDKKRDGFVLAEGAGVLILEELTHALNRNARIYGEVVGYGIAA